MAGASRRSGARYGKPVIAKLAIGFGLALAVLTAASVGQAHLRSTIEPSDTGLSGLYARLSLELESRLQTREAASEAVITLGPGGRDVRLSGELGEGAAERLARLLDENRHVERIHLTSEGGLVDEGEAIGAQIAARGLTTYVPDFCVSACTLAFVRGRERFIVRQARLGFHAPYETGLFGQDFQADGAPERAAYIAAGVDAAFVDAALNVPSNDLWIPDAERLVKARVATGIVDLRRFPDSTLDDRPDFAHARAALLRNFTLLQSFERDAPRVIDAIAAWHLDAYRSGLSEAESVEGLQRLAARAVSQALRSADDATLIALGRYLYRAMERTRTSDPRTCTAIGTQGNLVLAHDTLRRTDDLSARKLLLRATARAAAGQVDLDRQAIVQDALSQDALSNASQPQSGDCAASRRVYAEALTLPPQAAAASLRKLMLPPPEPRPLLEASIQP